MTPYAINITATVFGFGPQVGLFLLPFANRFGFCNLCWRGFSFCVGRFQAYLYWI